MKLTSLLLLAVSVWNCAGGGFDKGGHLRTVDLIPQGSILRSQNYTVLDSSEGESSTLFLFGWIPVTNPLNMDYALSQAVQKVPNGQSIVNVHYWHETHVYFPMATVSVLKVRGDVIALSNPSLPPDGVQKTPDKRPR